MSKKEPLCAGVGAPCSFKVRVKVAGKGYCLMCAQKLQGKK